MTDTVRLTHPQPLGAFAFPAGLMLVPVVDVVTCSLGWGPVPAAAVDPSASTTYDAPCGENRWDQVAPDSLCWPYGLHWHADAGRELLAVADSGNNRIVPWERS